MRKLLFGAAILFLVIFTAGFVSANQPCTTTARTGTLYFLDASGVLTADSTATIQFTQVTTGVPSQLTNRLFYGVLTYTLPTGSAVTEDIAAVVGDDNGIYNITGVSSPDVIKAEGGYQRFRDHSTRKRGWAFGITGSILDSSGWGGSFVGAFSN
jgi:hypothetical protein